MMTRQHVYRHSCNPAIKTFLLVLSLLALTGFPSAAFATQSFTMQASLFEGLDLARGMTEVDPHVLTLIFNPSDEVDLVLPSGNEELFTFTPDVDVYFGYDPDLASHITLLSENILGLSVLTDTNFGDVTTATLADLEFLTDPPAVALGDGDLAVLWLEDGTYMLLGSVMLLPDWTVQFTYQRVEPNIVPEPSTWVLIGVGCVGLLGFIKRTRRNDRLKGGDGMKRGKMWLLVIMLIPLLAGSASAAVLTVTKQGTGEGMVVGSGIDCGGDCTEPYPDETILHLEATPYAGSAFVGWLVDGESQEGTLVIRKDITVTAIFEHKPGRIALEFCGQSPNPSAGLNETSGILRAPNGEAVARIYWDEEQNHEMLSLLSGPAFEVEPYLTLVSNDAQTIVQVGGGEECGPYDATCFHTDLFFYNASGTLQNEIVKVHMASRVAISEDGYVAVFGRLRELAFSRERFVTLYDPAGNQIWRRSIGRIDGVTDINISKSAEIVAVGYRHQEAAEKADRPHHLLLLGQEGTEVFRYDNLKSVHHILFCEQDRYLVVQTFDTFSLQNFSSEEPSWFIFKKYRMVGPHTVRVLEDQNAVVLVTLDFSDPVSSKQLLYRWHVRLLDLSTGEELFVVDLPGLHSGYHGNAIVIENNGSFSVATADTLFCFRFTTNE